MTLVAVSEQVITLTCRQAFPELDDDGKAVPPATRAVPFHHYCRGMVLVNPNNKFELGSTLRLVCGRASVYKDTPRFKK